MITEGEAAIPLETTLHAFRNQEKTKQRSTIIQQNYAKKISKIQNKKKHPKNITNHAQWCVFLQSFNKVVFE